MKIKLSSISFYVITLEFEIEVKEDVVFTREHFVSIFLDKKIAQKEFNDLTAEDFFDEEELKITNYAILILKEYIGTEYDKAEDYGVEDVKELL